MAVGRSSTCTFQEVLFKNGAVAYTGSDTLASIVHTPATVFSSDLVNLEGVGPNFNGSVLNIKTDDAGSSFLTMDNGSGDLFSFSQAGTFAMADGTRQTITSTQTSGSELAITATPGSARTTGAPIVLLAGAGTEWIGDVSVLELDNASDANLSALNFRAGSSRTLSKIFDGAAEMFRISTVASGLGFWTNRDMATANAFTFGKLSSNGNLTASTAITQNWFNIVGFVNQSVTAGYNILGIDWTETATGSGAHRGIYVNAPTGFSGDLIRADVNGAEYFSVDENAIIRTPGSIFVSTSGSAASVRLHNVGFFVNTGTDEFLLGLDAAEGNQLVITGSGNVTKDHDHAVAGTPITFWHSSRDPDLSNQEWGSVTHTGAGFLFSSGPTTGAGSAPTTIDNFIGFAPRGTERVRFDGSGNVIQSALNADPGAGAMPFNSAVSFYVDEVTPALMVRVKTSAGAALTGTVCNLA